MIKISVPFQNSILFNIANNDSVIGLILELYRLRDVNWGTDSTIRKFRYDIKNRWNERQEFIKLRINFVLLLKFLVDTLGWYEWVIQLELMSD